MVSPFDRPQAKKRWITAAMLFFETHGEKALIHFLRIRALLFGDDIECFSFDKAGDETVVF